MKDTVKFRFRSRGIARFTSDQIFVLKVDFIWSLSLLSHFVGIQFLSHLFLRKTKLWIDSHLRLNWLDPDKLLDDLVFLILLVVQGAQILRFIGLPLCLIDLNHFILIFKVSILVISVDQFLACIKLIDLKVKISLSDQELLVGPLRIEVTENESIYTLVELHIFLYGVFVLLRCFIIYYNLYYFIKVLMPAFSD